MRKLTYLILLVTSSILLSACGEPSATTQHGSSMKAVIKTTALSAVNVAGIELGISIPYGVTPHLNADGRIDQAATMEVISTTPKNVRYNGATYTPATPVSPGALDIYPMVLTGFTATDEITIHLLITEGANPTESDFKLLSFKAYDTNGALVTGLNPALTTTIQ